MIKLSASVMKKVPIEGLSYSSRSCSAGIEIEMTGGAGTEAVRAQLRQLHALLEVAVDDQLATACRIPGRASVDGGPQGGHPLGSADGNGGSNGKKATGAQLRAVRAIAADLDMGAAHLQDIVRSEFDQESPCDLSVREASSLIDILKGNGKAEP